MRLKCSYCTEIVTKIGFELRRHAIAISHSIYYYTFILFNFKYKLRLYNIIKYISTVLFTVIIQNKISTNYVLIICF